MSKHKRQLIREAVKDMLLNQTDAGARVYSNRVTAFWNEEVPCISIFTTDEAATPTDLRQKRYSRKLILNIEIRAEAKENLDDVLDSLALKVEQLIDADLTLNNTAHNVVMTGTDIGFTGEATKPVGVLNLNYEVTYLTSSN